MGASDLAIALAVLAAAVWLLVCALRRGGGGCPGCAGGCSRPDDRRGPLVTLGRGPRGERGRGPQR